MLRVTRVRLVWSVRSVTRPVILVIPARHVSHVRAHVRHVRLV